MGPSSKIAESLFVWKEMMDEFKDMEKKQYDEKETKKIFFTVDTDGGPTSHKDERPQVAKVASALLSPVAWNYGVPPGSIQIINFKFQKIFEIQAHSLPIERLRVTQDNSNVFSAGQDGVFGIFTVHDKDPNKKDKEFSQVTQSEEILIEKQERDKFQADIEHLKNQIEIAKQNKEASVQQELDKKNKKISELSSEIENKEIENNNRYEQLLEAKKDMERMNKDKIYQMQQSH